MENGEEKDEFLNGCDLPKLKLRDVSDINCLITSNKMEAEIKSLSTSESPGPDGFTVQFYAMFQGISNIIISQTFPQNWDRKNTIKPSIKQRWQYISDTKAR